MGPGTTNLRFRVACNWDSGELIILMYIIFYVKYTLSVFGPVYFECGARRGIRNHDTAIYCFMQRRGVYNLHKGTLMLKIHPIWVYIQKSRSFEMFSGCKIPLKVSCLWMMKSSSVTEELFRSLLQNEKTCQIENSWRSLKKIFILKNLRNRRPLKISYLQTKEGSPSLKKKIFI